MAAPLSQEPVERHPDVSVIVPTRNRSALLNVTLRSVLGQCGIPLEVIIVDEASTDETPAVIAALGDARIRVLRHDVPQGLSAARNHGAAESRGEWLAFIDDDDLWAPEKLARQLQAAREFGRHWVYTGSVNIDGSRIVYSRPPLPPEETVAALPRYNAIPGGGSNVIARRTLWRRVGPFDTRFQGGEDWEMSLRLAKEAPPAWVCEPLMAKRVHSTNMFLDVTEIVRATKLLESVHQTEVDWGRMHRWLAERHLRAGQRTAALGEWAKASVHGQLYGAASDLGGILRRRLGRGATKRTNRTAAPDAWTAAAVAWLREFDARIH
jgi:glycosyltransferase involved in cell wall biosynthesis